MRDAVIDQLLDLLFDGVTLLAVGNATRGLAERTRGASVDLVAHDVCASDVRVALSKYVDVLVDEVAEF